MSKGLLYWILMLLWLIFGLWIAWPLSWASGGTILLFLVLLVLGWQVFGPPIQ
jgi:hypothetical protein